MADQTDNNGSPETAYAEAALAVTPAKVVTPVSTVAEAKPVAIKAVSAKVVPTVATVAEAEPAAIKPAAIKQPAVVVKKAKAKPITKPATVPTPNLSVTQLKDKIMASKTTDFTATINNSMTQAVTDMQGKAQEAFDKGTGLVAEMTDLAKGHVEAAVESGKIIASGIEGLSKTYAAEAKSAYETLTADFKDMAAIKSPTELFQLQGKIMRRNFDTLVATGTKSNENAMKLATDAFAPITARVNLAVEKLSKAA